MEREIDIFCTRQDDIEHVPMQPLLPGGEGDFGEGASWVDTSAIGDDPLILPTPFSPASGEEGGEKNGGVAGGFAARHTPYKNPPSWGEGEEGE